MLWPPQRMKIVAPVQAILWLLAAVLLATGCQSTSASRSPEASSEPELSPDPDRPSPVLPEVALVLGPYAGLELTITARRDGSIEQVVVSKPSRAKLYDEYTRKWVEEHWKMPEAKPGEADLRKFIAPIVYPKRQMPPGGSYPPPDYPEALLHAHVQGFLIVELKIAPSGAIEDARTILSSGNKQLDAHSVNWALRKWRFPPGAQRVVYWPVVYVMTN